MTLGAVFNQLNSPLARTVLAGLEGGTRDQGYGLQFTNAAADPALFCTLMDRLLERQIEALLLFQPPAEIEGSLATYRAADIPVIAVYSQAPSLTLPIVVNRPASAVRRAIDRLGECGHEHIAYLSVGSDGEDFPLPDLIDVAAELGMTLSVLPVNAPADARAVDETIAMFLEMATEIRRPTVLFARGRHIPLALIAARSLGWEVPDDLSVVSFGDDLWLQAHDPPSAAIVPDSHELGRVAAQTAVARSAGETIPSVLEIWKARWEPRGSAGPARIREGRA